MSNDELQLSVTEELIWDPKVDSNAIAVSAEEGVVTLRGTVGSLREKREAKKDAERVYGVKHVTNELDVQIMNDERRANADLRGDILHALTLNTLVPATVEAQVADGFVTLTGTANWQFQREEDEFVVSNVRGVISVTDEVRLVAPGPSAHDVQHSIKKAMERNAKLDAESVSVESENEWSPSTEPSAPGSITTRRCRLHGPRRASRASRITSWSPIERGRRHELSGTRAATGAALGAERPEVLIRSVDLLISTRSAR